MRHQHTFAYDMASHVEHKVLEHLVTMKQNLRVMELTESLHLIPYKILFLLKTSL